MDETGHDHLKFGEVRVNPRLGHRIIHYLKRLLPGFDLTEDETVEGAEALRVNIGNVGTKSVVKLTTKTGTVDTGSLRDFSRSLTDVLDVTTGDIEIASEDKVLQCYAEPFEECSSAVEPIAAVTRHEPSIKWSLCNYMVRPEKSEIDEIEACESLAIEVERLRDLDAIRTAIINYVTKYHSDPSTLIPELIKGKIVMTKDGLSHVGVSGNGNIFLTDYDETELKMTALSRTVYILFLMHPEGIRLADVCDYKDQLCSIYSIVKPGASKANIKSYIDTLCDTTSGSLNTAIARIKNAVKSIIKTPELAKMYYISGARGEKYGIPIDRDLINLHPTFTD